MTFPRQQRPGRDDLTGRGAVPCPTCGQPRPTLAVEAMLTRVAVAAAKQLLRDAVRRMIPSWG